MEGDTEDLLNFQGLKVQGSKDREIELRSKNERNCSKEELD